MEHTENTYSASILEDSISPAGKRITSMIATFPRSVLAEFNTHRQFSRNSASSRAIPVAKQIRKVMEHPFVPDRVGRNKAGMQAGEPLEGERLEAFQKQVLIQRDRAVVGVLEHLMGADTVSDLMVASEMAHVMVHGFNDHMDAFERLMNEYEEGMRNPERAAKFLNVHKETANRYLEPFMWHTVLVTATEWSNFFALRTHPHADPKIQTVAVLMKEAMESSTPNTVHGEEWHAPFLNEEERQALREGDESWLNVSVGRCARVSYLTHFGKRDPQKDIELAQRLNESGHMSPYEHVATPMVNTFTQSGNFKGWHQLRKCLPNEDDFAMRS